MFTINDLTEEILDIELDDDETATGGIAFAGETVRDFLDESKLAKDEPISALDEALKECGIEPLNLRESEFYVEMWNKDGLTAFRSKTFDSIKEAEQWLEQCFSWLNMECGIFQDLYYSDGETLVDTKLMKQIN